MYISSDDAVPNLNQIDANGRIVALPRGKQLGGSSAINFMFWTHASQRDIDNWGNLGNLNWSWSALEPYYRKSESYVNPSAQTEQDLQTQYIQPSLHGTQGPIFNTFPDVYGPLDEAWPRAYQQLGLFVQSDPRDGLATGGYTNLISIDLEQHTRSYAATAYYQPASKRPNLSVVTGALVDKILFETEPGGEDVTALGVQYTYNEEVLEVFANSEVLLCAGTFGSPQILELSGVGDPELLSEYDIVTFVDNNAVGENLQDHAYVPIGYEVIPGVPTLDDLSDPTTFENAYNEYITNHTGPLATTGASSALLSLGQITQAQDNISGICTDEVNNLGPGLTKQYKLLLSGLATEAVTQELTIDGGMSPQFVNDTTKLFHVSFPGNFFTLLGVLEHPFSRGSVHIQSANISDYPTIDPRYLSHPADLKLLSIIALHLQRIAATEPLSNLLKGNGTVYQPGYYELDESNVEDWIRQNSQSEFHPAGTCAMMPKELGGVVNERFKVYGTQNLRVVDASIFPLLPRANLQTLVYAIAERAADFIKADNL